MLSDHIDNVKKFMGLASQPTPEKPTVPSSEDRIGRVRLIMEEALEMANALGVSVYFGKKDNFDPVESHNDFCYYPNKEVNLVEVADAAIDLLWVGTTGAMVLCGMSDKLEECIKEVDRSNLSKFVDGYKCPDTGKWIKGPSYSPANIEGIINGK